MSHPSNPTPRNLPIVILESLPSKTFVGIDLFSFSSSPRFRGISSLPPGPHFLYTGTDASLSIRHGYWFLVDYPSSTPTSFESTLRLAHGTLSFVWNPELERLDTIPNNSSIGLISHSQHESARSHGLISYADLAAASAEQQLQSERNNNSKTAVARWSEITSFITEAVLKRILSSSPAVSERKDANTAPAPSPEATSQSSSARNQSQSTTTSTYSVSSFSTAPIDAEHILPGIGLTTSETADPQQSDHLVDLLDQPLHLLPIDLKRTFPPNAVGRARTEAVLDTSWYLSHLMDLAAAPDPSVGGSSTPDRASILQGGSNGGRKAGAAHLIGEMQLCFILGLVLANWSGVQGWRRLLAVVLGCRSAVTEIPGWFVRFLGVLSVQVRVCGEAAEEDGGGLLFEELRDDEALGIGRRGSRGVGNGGRWLRRLLAGFRRSLMEKDRDDDEKIVQTETQLKNELSGLEDALREVFGWELDDGNILKRGMLDLEDGERVEVEMDGADEEDETGEYAPVIVNLG